MAWGGDRRGIRGDTSKCSCQSYAQLFPPPHPQPLAVVSKPQAADSLELLSCCRRAQTWPSPGPDLQREAQMRDLWMRASASLVFPHWPWSWQAGLPIFLH